MSDYYTSNRNYSKSHRISHNEKYKKHRRYSSSSSDSSNSDNDCSVNFNTIIDCGNSDRKLSSYAQYVQYGAQTSIIAGNRLTFNTGIVMSPSITSITDITGTVFKLSNIGLYQITYQTTLTSDGSIVLYTGLTSPPLLSQQYTMIGKTDGEQLSNTILLETTACDTYISLNASTGNTTPLQIPLNASSTNQTSSTLSIVQLK